MSNAILKGNASGTGSVTLESPNTNSDRTISLPDADGTMVYANASGNVPLGISSIPSDVALGIYRGSGLASKLELAGNANSFGSTSFQLSQGGTGAAYIWQYANQPLVFATNATERMRIDSSGNLLVNGTTVYGKQTNFHNSSYVYASVSVGNNADHFIFKNDATTVGSINRVGGTGVVYNTSSDYRLKENVAPMTGALAKVQALKPCTYTWKLDGSAGQGFIAHELQEVIPEAVSGEKDAVEEDGTIKPQGIDQSRIVATLTAAIQELKEQVDAQALEIQALKGVE